MLNDALGIGIATIEGSSIPGTYYELTFSRLLGTVATYQGTLTLPAFYHHLCARSSGLRLCAIRITAGPVVYRGWAQASGATGDTLEVYVMRSCTE
jgi:hypothetical protein